MKQKIKNLRDRISKKSQFDEDFIDEISDIPVFDLFTPDRSCLVCEEKEIYNVRQVRFLEHLTKSNSDIVLFAVSLNSEEINDVNPLHLYLRYNIEEKELPHYPGKEFKFDIHNSFSIEEPSTLSDEYNVKIEGWGRDEYPILALRTKIAEEESRKTFPML